MHILSPQSKTCCTSETGNLAKVTKAGLCSQLGCVHAEADEYVQISS